MSYWRTYGVPIVITHCMNMIGPMQDPEKYVPKIILKILAGETIEVHGSENAIGSRMYLDVRNLADAWMQILHGDEPIGYPDSHKLTRFNIAGIEEINNLELVKRIRDILKDQIDFIGLGWEFVDFHRCRPGHDLRYALDSALFRETYRWEPPISIEQSLKDSVEHILANPEWRR